ncbi:MAG: DUF4416 family protein [Calditrichaceae bacterium]|jgi:hypothetical protein
MGKIKTHRPVKFFAAVTFQPGIELKRLMKDIENVFDAVDRQSDVYDFSRFTDYYRDEMGTNLKKLFIALKLHKEPENLIEYKILSNKLEEQYLQNGRRQVNIDPGYLTEAKVVLATTKDYSHRIYLGKGIFGDLHLYYENGSFRKQKWTYPDYQQDLAINFFNNLRIKFREEQARVVNGF